jgi:hypothetical protein
MTRSRFLIVTIVAAILIFPTIGLCDDEFPAPIAEALTDDKPGFVATIRWSELSRHPVVETAIEIAETGTTGRGVGPATQIVRELIGEVTDLGFDDGVIDEVWLVDGLGRSGAWLHSDLDDDAILTAIRLAEWEPDADDPSLWVQPETGEQSRWLEGMQASTDDPEEFEEILAMIDASRKRIAIRPDGWMRVARGSGIPTDAATDGLIAVDSEEVHFPRNGLLIDDNRALITFAVDLSEEKPESDAASDEESAAERESLRRRLKELESSDEAMMAQIGDFAGSVSEVDGGLVLDVLVKRNDAGDLAETQRFFTMMLLGARFAVAPTAPDLDRELGDTTIAIESDGIRITARLGNSTLIDTLRQEAERAEEAEKLRTELRDLEENDETHHDVDSVPPTSP